MEWKKGKKLRYEIIVFKQWFIKGPTQNNQLNLNLEITGEPYESPDSEASQGISDTNTSYITIPNEGHGSMAEWLTSESFMICQEGPPPWCVGQGIPTTNSTFFIIQNQRGKNGSVAKHNKGRIQ